MNFPKIKRSQLSNGMILITENNPRANSLSLGFWAKAGSAIENESEHGVAHFVEHLMFKGTKKRSPLQIAREIEKVGGEINAFTDREAICYHTTILAQDLQIALGLFSDILQNSTFPETEIKKERDVIFEEIKMYEDSPEDLVVDLLYETMFSKQIFGRSIIGTKKSLKNINRKTLWQFYKKTHNPGNIFVTAAGRIDHDKLAEEIEKSFGKTNFKKIDNAINVVPEFSSTERKKPIEQTHLVMGFAADKYESRNKYALKLLNVYLGCGMGSLLFQRIREDLGLAYSVYSALNLHAETGVLLIYAGTSPSQVKKCISAINDVVSSVVKNGISKKLLDETKKQLKGLLLLSAESPDERMTSLGNCELYTGKTLELKKEISFIESVNVADIKRVAEKTLTKDYAFVSVGPRKTKRSN